MYIYIFLPALSECRIIDFNFPFSNLMYRMIYNAQYSKHLYIYLFIHIYLPAHIYYKQPE